MSALRDSADAHDVGILGRSEQRVAAVSGLAAVSVAVASLGAVTWAVATRDAGPEAKATAAAAYGPADLDADDLALQLMGSVQQRLDAAFLLVDAGDTLTAAALIETLADDMDLVVRLASRRGSTVRDELARFLALQRGARATLAALRLPGNGVSALRGSLDRAEALVVATRPGGPAPAATPAQPAATPAVPTVPGTTPSLPVPSVPAPSVSTPAVPGLPSGPVTLPTGVPTAAPSLPVTPPTSLPLPTLTPRPLPTLLPL
jgi:hypothetical protein